MESTDVQKLAKTLVSPPTRVAPVGLIAGWGRYPLLIAQALHRQQIPVYGLGILGHADPAIAKFCVEYRTLGIAKLGQAFRFLRRHQVQQVTMAGKVHKVLLFRKFYWWRHFPDWTFFRTFYPHFITKTRDRKDDTMLGTFVDAFQQHGIRVAPATDFAPELLVKHGMIVPQGVDWKRCGWHPLTRGQQKDIAFGWKLATEMGRLDVGQSVAIKGRAVLAVEAVEGTDECIRRAGKLCPAGGFTVVKIAKPQQDMRFDVPTVGLGTVRTMKESGGRVLAIEADRTILLDRDEVIRFASENGITLVALHADDLLDNDDPQRQNSTHTEPSETHAA